MVEPVAASHLFIHGVHTEFQKMSQDHL